MWICHFSIPCLWLRMVARKMWVSRICVNYTVGEPIVLNRVLSCAFWLVYVDSWYGHEMVSVKELFTHTFGLGFSVPSTWSYFEWGQGSRNHVHDYKLFQGLGGLDVALDLHFMSWSDILCPNVGAYGVTYRHVYLFFSCIYICINIVAIFPLWVVLKYLNLFESRKFLLKW